MKFTALGVLSFCMLYISSVQTRSLSDSDLIVETTSGLVKGAFGGLTSVGQKPIYWFRSIPFAEPPVGNLRFRPPVPVKRWSGVRDVSQRPSECLQGDENSLTGSEDCLYLKIHTTELPRHQKKLPVMVWIYGGAFIGGHINFDLHSPDLLLDEGVMVVALNYRTGILGFLSTEDSVVPGNNGLKDQIFALRWIKENIERFGGDPHNVTLFGQSAGGASIGYFLQTPQTKGLFHRVILQSGTSLCLWSLTREPLSVARAVAADLGVNTQNSQVLVDGLRNIDAEELQIAHMQVMIRLFLSVNLREGLLFSPVIEPEHEGAVLTGGSHQLLTEGKFHDVPIILGYTSMEAVLQEVPDALRLLLVPFDVQPSRLVPIDMNINNLLARNAVGRQIRSEYFGTSLISTSNLKLMEFISHDQFTRAIQESAHLYARKNPVYFYKFSHEGSLFGVTDRNFPGVGHTEDLAYIFDFGHKGSAEDYLTRSRVVKLWTNFAKTGNPTPEADPLLNGVQWPSLNELDVRYLEINRDLKVLHNPDYKSFSFWTNLYNNNGNPPYATY